MASCVKCRPPSSSSRRTPPPILLAPCCRSAAATRGNRGTRMRPIIISVAITGSVPRKKDNPALPVLPAEQIESTQAAYEAGATLVHLHVRNDDESSSSDPDRFAEVQAGVRKHCPGMVVQFSTGGPGREPAGRGLSPAPKPDMASLSTASTNFSTIVYANPAGVGLDLSTRT